MLVAAMCKRSPPFDLHAIAFRLVPIREGSYPSISMSAALRDIQHPRASAAVNSGWVTEGGRAPAAKGPAYCQRHYGNVGAAYIDRHSSVPHFAMSILSTLRLVSPITAGLPSISTAAER